LQISISSVLLKETALRRCLFQPQRNERTPSVLRARWKQENHAAKYRQATFCRVYRMTIFAD